MNGFRRHGPGLGPPYDGHSASGPSSTIRRVLQRVRWLPSSPVSRNDGTSELLSPPPQLSTIRAIAMACADFGGAINAQFLPHPRFPKVSLVGLYVNSHNRLQPLSNIVFLAQDTSCRMLSGDVNDPMLAHFLSSKYRAPAQALKAMTALGRRPQLH